MRISRAAIPLILIALIASGCISSGEHSDSVAVPGYTAATDIYKEISPSIVYIDTPTGTGSGIYIEGGYILTCAHVPWPFTTVRVVFPNGAEYQVDVLSSDPMADLAVLGPVSASAPVLSLSSSDDLNIGDTVFIIGYPGEDDEYPQPSLSQGLVSRLRQWNAEDLTYIQTDAVTAGGASGGALVSGYSEVIGMIGFTYSDVFGLGASAEDIAPRVDGLIAGEDVSGLGNRDLPLYGGATAQQATLKHRLDTRIFIINEPEGTPVDIEGSSDNDIALYLIDAGGYTLAEADDGFTGSESLSADTEYDAPYFLVVRQFDDSEARVKLSSSCDLIPLDDVDDGQSIEAGQTIYGNIDCPGDWDCFTIDLDAFETVTITVDSIAIDAYVEVGSTELVEGAGWNDDDSGGGLFGTDSELEFTAPQTGTYYISVSDVYDEWAGGYILSVE